MNKLHTFLFSFLIVLNINLLAQNQNDAKMQWFADAKLGIFIHWGIYAVNGIDESWSYPALTRNQNRYTNDSARWQRFSTFNQAQINELSQKFNPDLFWFDGDWEHTAAEWNSKQIRDKILKFNPNAIINSRLQGYGDYATLEQGLPLIKPVVGKAYWSSIPGIVYTVLLEGKIDLYTGE